MNIRAFRKSPQLDLMAQTMPLIVDNFAGGGGASTGIEKALGRSVDIAINHNPKALAMHQINHPQTKHFCEDVWAVDPVKACAGRPVVLAWFSPDCTHHSKAKGAKPRDKKIRGLAWIVLKWAALVKPSVIMLENVEEFKDWGPLTRSKKPCKKRKGQTFEKWKNQLIDLGYTVDTNIIKAHEYGAPTIRKRLYIVARRDGLPIVWRDKTHGPGLKPVKRTADYIDWSLPCPSIFLTKEQGRKLGVKRPLVENTMKRIAKGIQKFVIDEKNPFILKTGHTKWNKDNGAYDINSPLSTIVTKAEHYLIQAFISRHFGESIGHSIKDPSGTITANGGGKSALVTSHIIKLKGDNLGHSMNEPIQTITAGGNHFGEVRAFLIKYYGTGAIGSSLNEPCHTITANDRLGLITIKGEDYQIVDIGMRMLTPGELFRLSSFDADYIHSFIYEGKQLSKTDQVAMVGNAVPPVIPEILVQDNIINFGLMKRIA